LTLPPQAVKTTKKAAGPTKKAVKFTIELAKAVEDKVLVTADFVSPAKPHHEIGACALCVALRSPSCPSAVSALQVTFLQKTIKVGGKAGALGDLVKVDSNGTKVTVTTTAPLAKRYLKYLTKKYLKQNSLREYMRVIANTKNGYELRYFKVGEAAADDEE
jgi:large subunit ribosomal protein L22e